jgi:hypothetical protein
MPAGIIEHLMGYVRVGRGNYLAAGVGVPVAIGYARMLAHAEAEAEASDPEDAPETRH